MEFMFLVGLSFVIIFVFSVSILAKLEDSGDAKAEKIAKEVALSLQRELTIASAVQDGYSREVALSGSMDAINYTLSTTGDFLTVTTDEAFYTVRLPEADGQFRTGNNTITKEAGEIHVLN